MARKGMYLEVKVEHLMSITVSLTGIDIVLFLNVGFVRRNFTVLLFWEEFLSTEDVSSKSID